MTNFFKTFILVSINVLAGCASSQVSLFTNPPQAIVYAKPLGEGKRVLIGHTPLLLNSQTLGSQTQSTGPLLIEFEKEGYQSKSLVLSDIKVNNLLLNIEMQPADGLGDSTTTTWLVENSFEVQRLVKTKRYDEALKILVEMKRVGPQVSTTHELLGGIYYLQGKYVQAFDSYKDALRFNPKSAEALRMTSILKEVVKERLPTSEGGDRGQ